MINYSYYPILKGARRDIKEFDQESILFAQENIEKYTPTKNINIDIPVWLISTIMIHNLGNNFLTRKFVTNYSKLFESHFLKDIDNKDIRTDILNYFGINGDIVHLSTPPKFLKIRLMDYLELEVVTEEPRFKLVNQVLEKGWVFIERQRFVYLVRLVLEKQLFQRIKNMKDYYGDQTINEVVNQLKEKYPETKKRLTVSDGMVVPESIKELIDIAYRDHHLSHNQRIKLGIYMQAQGYEIDDILEIYKQCSDYSEATTRYQLNSLKRYIKP